MMYLESRGFHWLDFCSGELIVALIEMARAGEVQRAEKRERKEVLVQRLRSGKYVLRRRMQPLSVFNDSSTLRFLHKDERYEVPK